MPDSPPDLSATSPAAPGEDAGAALRASRLAACADEPIRVPGGIQPHGRLLVLTPTADRLAACSANWPDDLALLPMLADLLPALDGLQPGEPPAPLARVLLDGEPWDATGHRTDAHLLIEFEPAAVRPGPAADADGPGSPLQRLVRDFLPRVRNRRSVVELCEQAALEMRELTGFGRCLVYRFDDEGHGEVLAESRDEGYPSYLDHRFPAGDIPPQARALYLANHLRLIPDAHYVPVPLRCIEPGLRPTDIDLSFAALRSVSPVHLEYMRNMGTPASLSVSIVVRGRLWGLVSCHHDAPRHVTLATRAACEHLGRLLSLQVEAREDTAELATRGSLRQLTLEIVSHLAESDGTLRQMIGEPVPLLQLADAAGAAVVLDDQCWTTGQCPAPADIQAISRWVELGGGEVVETDRLPALLPGVAGDRACGVLAVSISQVHRHQILWFRPELVRTIRWAGDPRKEVSAEDGRLHPRRSFASWVEQRRGRSRPWTPAEVSAVGELRQALIGIVLRRAEEMAGVATELGRVNKELEAFSYTVSHDLRAPMRHIAGYVDLVVDADGERLGDRSRRYLDHVKEAAAYAGHLVDALLDFSRLGRAALKRVGIDTGVMVSDLVRELSLHLGDRRVEWQVPPRLPQLWGDAFLVQVAVRNLLTNALKYSRDRDPARIEVVPLDLPEGVGLEVRDNGVGFDMRYVDKLFGVFQRLHQADEFDGTGIGLANVRRIVERHGGRVWARGEPGRGAAFGFLLPLRRRETP